MDTSIHIRLFREASNQTIMCLWLNEEMISKTRLLCLKTPARAGERRH